VLATVALGQFLAVASSSIVSVALPSIGRDLGASSTALQWIIDAFLIVFAGLLVAGGVLGDRRGRKGAFLTGVALFLTGSLACALAPGIGALIAARVVQGLGPALVLPSSLAIVTAVFPDPGERARAIGLWSAAAGLGLALGPVIGGVIVDALGWRWVFGFNVPLCVLILVLGAVTVPRIVPAPSPHRFDTVGAVLTSLGTAAVVFAIIEGGEEGWGSPRIVAAFAAGALALTALVGWERRHPAPLIDVGLFRSRRFVAANAGGVAVFFALIGAVVYLSIFLQQVQGRTPAQAGLCLLPMGAALALVAPLAGRLVGRAGARVPMVGGLLVAALGAVTLLALERETPYADLWWRFMLVGAGCGLCLTPMTATAVAAVPPARAGMASAIHNSLRMLGQALGVAVLGTIVYATAGAAGYVAGLHRALALSAAVLVAAAVLAAVALRPVSRTGSPGARSRPGG